MQLSIMKASKVFAAATAMSAMGFITVPGTAQADPATCTLDAPQLTIDISDGSVYTIDWSGTHPTGGAKSVYEGGKVKFGNAAGPGVVPASPYPNIDFTINWGDVTNHITGQIDPMAGFAYGHAVKGGNASGSEWSAQHEHFTCATNQTPAGQKTATVTSDVDVYQSVDPNTGGVNKLGILRAGKTVNIVGSCQPQDWCEVSGPAVPTGDGHVWGALQF